jgi:flagellar M-ring protein FliF
MAGPAQAGTAQAGTALERAGAAGLMGRAGSLATQVRARWMAIPAGQRRWIGASGFIVAAVCAAMLWYAGRTDWRVLYSGLDAKDVQQIAQELAAAGIPYEVTEDGSGVKVGADQMDKARMEVATKGMPQSGRMGFELFDKPNWVGSEFDEQVNYQRAMEGELEHTIGTLSAVRSARVHLVLPKETMFAGEQHEAKASVVLKLKRSVMPPEQAESIRNLVAGAVESLTPEQVTLVDADGRVSMNAQTKGAAEMDAERSLEEKLVAMLELTVGHDNVRATVNVSYDESSVEKTDEVYDPAQTATLSMQKTSQTVMPTARATGVPGTVSNTPAATAPGAANAATTAAVPPLMQVAAKDKDAGLPVFPQANAGATQSSTEESGTYGVTKHMTHEEHGPGRVRRLTAAIVVNDRMMMEGAGKQAHEVWKPRSAQEMTRLQELAKAAVGFDSARGDEVVVENVGFSSNVPEVAPAMPEKLMEEAQDVLHQQPGLLKSAGWAGLALLLMVMVVRPLTRQMVASMKVAGEPMGLAAGGAAVTETERALAAGTTLQPRVPSAAAGIFDHVTHQIRQEPGQSTRLLSTWIGQTVEGGVD